MTNFNGTPLTVGSFESRMAREMESLLQRQNLVAQVAPSMREVPFSEHQEVLDFIEKLKNNQVDILILMTGVGTRFLTEIVEKVIPRAQWTKLLQQVITVARGPKSLKALKDIGVDANLLAPEPNTWQDVIHILGNVQDKRVFVQEYGVQNKEFCAQLKKSGARLHRVPIYRWALPQDTAPMRQLIHQICDGKIDALFWTNATQLHHALRLASEEGLEQSFIEALTRLVNMSIGPVMSETLKEHHIPVDWQVQNAKIGIMVQEGAACLAQLIAAKRANVQKTPVQVYPIQNYDARACQDSVFMKACRQESTKYRPVWLMRQAGRYMKSYRDLRAKVSFLELCKNSDLACEVTVQAQQDLGVDAAILFSDILLIVEPMGLGLEYTRGDGPCIARALRSADDIERLRDFSAPESLNFVLQAIKKIRSALPANVPLIGFAGAPFTLASYMIEGQGSRQYLHTKQLMYNHPQAWHQLMRYLSAHTASYLQAQIKAGVQAVQVFDSWIGCLSQQDYKEYVLPHMKNLFDALPQDVPSIHFGTGNASFIEQTALAGGSVIGIDWRMPLAETWQRLGNVAVQGNLDPTILCADWPIVEKHVRSILKQTQGKPGHIFNLGHGILPQTPFANAKALVELVQQIPI